MSITDDRELHALFEEINALRHALYVANENGFLCNDHKRYMDIADLISGASYEISLAPPNKRQAITMISDAKFLFNQSMNQTSFRWRLTFQHGAGILAYLILVSVGIFMAWFFFSPVHLDSEILWVPSWAFLWGAMGGVLQGFWNLWHFVAYSGLRKLSFIRFASLPLMGAILGALAYLVFFAGFIAVTGGAQTASESFIMLLCALAGFSSKWAIDILNNLTDMIKVGGPAETSAS